MSSKYAERLKHPKWQRRRLQIMSAADWKCVRCQAADQPLNVHHKLYRDGAEPWEYADDELVCLCEQCHENEHRDVFTRAEVLKLIESALAGAAKKFDDLLARNNEFYDRLFGEHFELLRVVDELRLKLLPAEERKALEAHKAETLKRMREHTQRVS